MSNWHDVAAQADLFEDAGIAVTLPKPATSGMEAKGQFGKHDFVYLADDDAYRCPAGEVLSYHSATIDSGRTIRRYWTHACVTCQLKARCTKAKNRSTGQVLTTSAVLAQPRCATERP